MHSFGDLLIEDGTPVDDDDDSSLGSSSVV
jgi:hypothetical protein